MSNRILAGNPSLRRLGRVLALLAIGLTAWLGPAAWRYLLAALSPHVAVCSALSLRFASVLPLLSVPMVLVMALRHRFWCRHLCPVGLISECCGKLRRGRKAGEKRQPISRRVPSSTGRVLALASLGGAAVGYPLFLWTDPLALFSGFFSFSGVCVAGLVIVILLSVASPGLWCSRICPLGGTQDLLFRLSSRNTRRSQTTKISQRRVLLAAGLGAVLSTVIPRVLLAKKRCLRPPGAVDETALKGSCIRCGNCTRSCPSGIIEPSVDCHDIAGLLVPKLKFNGTDYCLQDCNKCGLACPTGVIRPLPLPEKNRQVIGIARIDLPECLLTMDAECGLCVPRCPRGAIVEQFSRETYTTTVKVIAEKCNGCGACVGICPAHVVMVDAV